MGSCRPDLEAARAKRSAMIQLVDSAVATTRKIVTDLRPSILDDLGLAAALRWQIGEYEKHTKLAASLSKCLDPDICDRSRTRIGAVPDISGDDHQRRAPRQCRQCLDTAGADRPRLRADRTRRRRRHERGRAAQADIARRARHARARAAFRRQHVGLLHGRGDDGRSDDPEAKRQSKPGRPCAETARRAGKAHRSGFNRRCGDGRAPAGRAPRRSRTGCGPANASRSPRNCSV